MRTIAKADCPRAPGPWTATECGACMCDFDDDDCAVSPPGCIGNHGWASHHNCPSSPHKCQCLVKVAWTLTPYCAECLVALLTAKNRTQYCGAVIPEAFFCPLCVETRDQATWEVRVVQGVGIVLV